MQPHEYELLKAKLTALLEQDTSEFIIYPPGFIEPKTINLWRCIDSDQAARLRFIHQPTSEGLRVYVLISPNRRQKIAGAMRLGQLRLEYPDDVMNYVIDELIQVRAEIAKGIKPSDISLAAAMVPYGGSI